MIYIFQKKNIKMKKIKEFIENNHSDCDILNYYNGHEATKGCKSGKDNINPYALIFDKEKAPSLLKVRNADGAGGSELFSMYISLIETKL